METAKQNGVAVNGVNGVNGVSPVTEELLNDVHAKLHDEGAKETVLARISTVTKPGITRDEVMDQYSDWVKNSDYEDIVTGVGGYVGHKVAVKYFTDHYPADKRGEARVLDVGAGTGMVARGLRENGFTHIDALDPSDAMLSVAKKDNLYDNYICEFLTDKQLPIPADSYDGVTAAACFSANHVPCAALHELIRIVKPGGLITIVTRIDYLSYVPEYKDRLEPLMQQLEKEGKWKLLERVIGPRFYLDKESIIWTHQVKVKSSE